jgi:acyl-homoserine lactone synthase
MIHIVTAENIQLYRPEMEQAYRLRHQVFVDEMKWEDLRKPDSREIDQFDNAHAMHMLYICDGELLGYQRMLPTTTPHLLSDVMPHLCDGERPVGVNVWEWTRYCVKLGHRDRGRTLSPIGNALLSAIVEWGLENGVDRIIIQMDPIWMLRLVQLHFRVDPLGFPQRMKTGDTIAVTAGFNRNTLRRLHEMRGNDSSVLLPFQFPERRLVS